MIAAAIGEEVIRNHQGGPLSFILGTQIWVLDTAAVVSDHGIRCRSWLNLY